MIIKPPKPTNVPPEFPGQLSVFLAGSIENGSAILWQKEMGEFLSDKGYIVLDPRRDDWDSSWEQNIENAQFSQQVNWELENLETCSLVLMYFDTATKSPISLLELGLIAGSCPEKLIVVCPQGFWRKGNVDIVCNRYGVIQFESLEDCKTWISKRQPKFREKL